MKPNDSPVALQSGTSPAPYAYTQRGRGIYSIFGIAFTAFLAVGFFLIQKPVGVVIGLILSFFAGSGIYAFFKGETWSIRIEDGFLSWSYARWPKSSGRIDLSTVRAVVVNDCSSRVTFTFSDNRTRKIKLVGPAGRIRDYLVAHFPDIKVEWVEGT